MVWEVAMQIGNVKSPAAPEAPQRVDAPAASGAVATQLPPESAVRQVEAAEAVRLDIGAGAQARAALDAALRDVIERNLTIDPKSREVVSQTVNKETGEVLRQVPDEAILRLRAYARQMRQADAGGPADRVA